MIETARLILRPYREADRAPFRAMMADPNVMHDYPAPFSAEEADAYFASRARSSQIGAWASRQSSPLESRYAFEKAIALQAARFAIGAVPRPPFWIGYRVTPTVMEFWHDRPFRLHDRIAFRRPDPAAAWTKTRLYP